MRELVVSPQATMASVERWGPTYQLLVSTVFLKMCKMVSSNCHVILNPIELFNIFTSSLLNFKLPMLYILRILLNEYTADDPRWGLWSNGDVEFRALAKVRSFGISRTEQIHVLVCLQLRTHFKFFDLSKITHHLLMGIRSEKGTLKWFHACVSIKVYLHKPRRNSLLHT